MRSFPDMGELEMTVTAPVYLGIRMWVNNAHRDVYVLILCHFVLHCVLCCFWSTGMLTMYLPCAGLDYVGHEDVLPYKTTQKQPIFNHLFDKFLVASDTTAGTVATDCFYCDFSRVLLSFSSPCRWT